MITDARVLDTDFVPSDILHRHDELNALSQSLALPLEQHYGDRSYVFGPSGSGKTCLARYLLHTLRETHPKISTQYINAWHHHAPFAFLFQLVDGVGPTHDIDERSTSHDELLNRVRERDEELYVVVIDEADQLDDPQLLYHLNRMAHLHLIFVANQEEQFFATLDDRLFSRLSVGERVHLDRYSDDEIQAILERRATAGLELNVAPAPIREQIAALADGDARCAIEMLKVAARTARAAGHTQITTGDVIQAETTARENLRQKTVSKLTRHQRVLYEILQAADEPVPMGTVSEEYRHRVSNPKTRQTLRRYLKKLASYNLVTIEGATSGRTYAAV
ncbi:Cdc6/Cdc18 family protein [Haloglomus litoreum]|uniref:Cdc6/Cdc18 family protein n=1 Tax=Haloglomus litoreum TaxID=3034026 RepID=UPI0023E77E5B|nr:Cdc6/Cdc18 family protein [Haloglomus sp. DT116]